VLACVTSRFHQRYFLLFLLFTLCSLARRTDCHCPFSLVISPTRMLPPCPLPPCNEVFSEMLPLLVAKQKELTVHLLTLQISWICQIPLDCSLVFSAGTRDPVAPPFHKVIELSSHRFVSSAPFQSDDALILSPAPRLSYPFHFTILPSPQYTSSKALWIRLPWRAFWSA